MDRTTTPRTLREAFGQDVRLHDDEQSLLRWPRPELLALGMVVAGCMVALAGVYKDADRLKVRDCQYVAPTLDGQHIWQCRDGWRVNDVAGDAL
jgi:hypothetical protein